MDYVVILVIALSIVLFSWVFATLKYLDICKVIKRTKTNVNECMKNVNTLQEQVDIFRIIVNNVNEKVNDIENRVKNIQENKV